MEPGTLILVVGAILLAAVAAAAVAGRGGRAGARRVPRARDAARERRHRRHRVRRRTPRAHGRDHRPRDHPLRRRHHDAVARDPSRDPAGHGAEHGRRRDHHGADGRRCARIVFPLSWSASFLLGAVVASTDAAAVFSTLRVTNVRRRLARVLEAESGANDPIAVALTIGLIQFVQDSSYGVDDLLLLVVRQLSLGLVIGLAVGVTSAWALGRVQSTRGSVRARRDGRRGCNRVRARRHRGRQRIPGGLHRRPLGRQHRDPAAPVPRQFPRGSRVPGAGRALHRARPVRLPAPARAR